MIILLISILFSLSSSGGEKFSIFDIRDLLNGFLISTPNPSEKPNYIGCFFPVKSNPPCLELPPLRIAQWGTRIPISPNDFKSIDNCLVIANNECKKFEITICNKERETIKLNCNGIAEFEGKLRRYGEPWPHLLIEHTNLSSINISQFELNFEIKFRISKCTVDPDLEEKIDQSLHTAQVTAYWTVVDKNPNSPHHNDFFWFGIPIFDHRYDIPPKYCDLDKGAPTATNKIIYVMDGTFLWRCPTGDGDWKSLKTEITPFIMDALKEIKGRGYFINSNPEDFCLTTFNIGWEVTGPFDGEIEFATLRLTAKKK